jgi:large subunit ribosomal protein L24
VQTTLLSFAIIVILALVAALVGPLFVDWSSYRGEFEGRASRLTGLEFRVTGPIDVRLLPTPMLTMHGIEFGRAGDDKVRARTLHIEFALGRLLQGEWRIEDARLEGPELGIRIDDSGRVAWPLPAVGFAPEGVSIQRLDIEHGRVAFVHDASGARLLLEDMEFKGDVRSLAGPVRGEGSFVLAGHHYPYRIGMSRVAPDGSMKIRLNIDPADRTLDSGRSRRTARRGQPCFRATAGPRFRRRSRRPPMARYLPFSGRRFGRDDRANRGPVWAR